MKIKSIICLAALVCSVPALAEDADSKWTLNLREVSLSYSNTTVGNAREYRDSPISQFSMDSQYNIVGKFDALLDNEQDIGLWRTNLLLNYGKVKIKPVDEPADTTESADKIWLSTEYAFKMWNMYDTDIGPFGQIAFQTEFTANQDAPRYKVLSGREGIKAFEGEYVKELYIAAVQEYDFTYSDNRNEKFAWEVGGRFEYPFREGVKFTATARYTDYFHYSRYVATDLKYDLDLTAKMEVAMTDTISLAPYVSYRRGEARGARKAGDNFVVGLSLKYADLFNLN